MPELLHICEKSNVIKVLSTDSLRQITTAFPTQPLAAPHTQEHTTVCSSQISAVQSRAALRRMSLCLSSLGLSQFMRIFLGIIINGTPVSVSHCPGVAEKLNASAHTVPAA